jgi:adenosylmethionine-8-amino-7-oxononanoate aminotransferase
MRDWLKRDPTVIVSGRGAVLRDVRGREYLDGNSSIWTNLHGHNHPKLNAAIARQLKKIAHSSALGLANEPASLLAERLVTVANRPLSALKRGKGGKERMGKSPFPLFRFSPPPFHHGRLLQKVFFSDDGSTAIEVALKLAYEFTRRTGQGNKPKFLSLDGAYHGDTVGAVSLGHIDLFRESCRGLHFESDKVMAPYCYRCPFNRAKPERADAREYRKCNWECVGKVEQKFVAQKKRGKPYAAFVVEPLIQGAAGMIPQPSGWLRQVTELVRGNGALLIADEVMTGFGRTGTAMEKTRKGERELLPTAPLSLRSPATLFACHHEGVQPDFLCLAKGMTGGYLPMAATLTTQAVFDSFLGEYGDFKTFFHGHSYTANQLGAASALASLGILQSPASIRERANLEATLRDELKPLWSLSNVGDIRHVGLIIGVELVRGWRTREPFDLRERAGIRVCEAMAKRGVLTRPIGNVVVLMPPYSTTQAQARKMVRTIAESVSEVFGKQHL